MNLYLLQQSVNNNYDTYDSAVVCAPDQATAKSMDPGNGSPICDKSAGVWVTDPDLVHCTLIGVSADPTQRVVCSSFNAG